MCRQRPLLLRPHQQLTVSGSKACSAGRRQVAALQTCPCKEDVTVTIRTCQEVTAREGMIPERESLRQGEHLMHFKRLTAVMLAQAHDRADEQHIMYRSRRETNPSKRVALSHPTCGASGHRHQRLHLTPVPLQPFPRPALPLPHRRPPARPLCPLHPTRQGLAPQR